MAENDEEHGLPERPQPVAPNYFLAAGIIIAAYGLYINVLLVMGQLGLAGNTTAILLAAVFVVGVVRLFSRFHLGLRHAAPFMIVGVLIGALVLFS